MYSVIQGVPEVDVQVARQSLSHVVPFRRRLQGHPVYGR